MLLPVLGYLRLIRQLSAEIHHGVPVVDIEGEDHFEMLDCHPATEGLQECARTPWNDGWRASAISISTSAFGFPASMICHFPSEASISAFRLIVLNCSKFSNISNWLRVCLILLSASSGRASRKNMITLERAMSNVLSRIVKLMRDFGEIPSGC